MFDITGKATRASAADIDAIANDAKIDPAALRAVMAIEAPRGPFDGKRPSILFEPQHFWRNTSGAARAAAAKAGLAHPKWGAIPYGSFASQYDKLARAMAIDETAALLSTSWGGPQLMGFNHGKGGFDDVRAMVRAFADSEAAQVRGMVAFIASSRLTSALRACDWPRFARGYNGAGYAKNQYDTKLAAAYAAERAKARVVAAQDRTLAGALAARGFDVADITAAVREYQKSAGLKVDGIAGPMTRKTLGL